MKSFQGKLPAIKYRIKVKTGKGIRKFLESYGCELDKHVEDDTSNVITVYCGGLYDYDVGSTGNMGVVVTPKEFKRIVRKALGESKMKPENVKVGTKVRVKTEMNEDVLPFYLRHRGSVGTVIEAPDVDGDVKVEFSDGIVDIGHYSNLKRIKEKHS